MRGLCGYNIFICLIKTIILTNVMRKPPNHLLSERWETCLGMVEGFMCYQRWGVLLVMVSPRHFGVILCHMVGACCLDLVGCLV